MTDLASQLASFHNPPPPEPLVTCPNDKIGTDDIRWTMMQAVVHRQRSKRLEAARTVIRSRSPHISAKQRQLMHDIIDGKGDMLLQKCIEHNIDPE